LTRELVPVYNKRRKRKSLSDLPYVRSSIRLLRQSKGVST